MTITQTAEFLRAHDDYLIVTHRRPDGDTVGCAAALCAALRGMGKRAEVLENREATALYAPYLAPYLAGANGEYATVVTVDVAARSLFPDNAASLAVDLAIDHHASYEGFARESCVDASCAACGEIVCALCEALGGLTAECALPLYVAVSTDTGCFVYSNVTANTHRVAARLIETGIDFRTVNKRHFRTKTKKRLALEAELLRTMEFFDGGRVVFVTLPRALVTSLALSEADMEDIASLGGLVEGADCSVTMKETADGAWKVSLRTGARVDANAVCARFAGGGHHAAAGCILRGMTLQQGKQALLEAIAAPAKE